MKLKCNLWRRKWQPTPAFLPGESHGQRNLGGYCPWGHRVGHDWAKHNISSVQLLIASDSLWLHGLQYARLPCLSPNSQSLLKLMSIESVMPSNHLILCHPLLLLPSMFPSMRVFSSELVLPMRWPKYWRFSFSISPSNEYSGLTSFKIGCFDLLRLWRVFSNTTVQKHKFFCAHLSLRSNSYTHTWLLEKP